MIQAPLSKGFGMHQKIETSLKNALTTDCAGIPPRIRTVIPALNGVRYMLLYVSSPIPLQHNVGLILSVALSGDGRLTVLDQGARGGYTRSFQ